MKVQSTKAPAELLTPARAHPKKDAPQTSFKELLAKSSEPDAAQTASSKPAESNVTDEAKPDDASDVENAKPDKGKPSGQETQTAERHPESDEGDAGTVKKRLTEEMYGQAVTGAILVPVMLAADTSQEYKLPETAAQTAVEKPSALTASSPATQAVLPQTQNVPQVLEATPPLVTTPQAEAAPPPVPPPSAEAAPQTEPNITIPQIAYDVIPAEPDSEALTQALTGQPSVSVQPPVDDAAQARFDALLAQASQQLQDAQASETTQPEPPEPIPQTREPAYENPQTAQPHAERPVFRRPSPPQHEQVLSAQENTIELMPQKPVTPVEQPRQISETSPAEQITAQVVKNFENQKMEFRMQLQPLELGKIDVRMVLESGKLSVYIMAENSKTLESLHRQADGLTASLRVSGIQLENVQIVQQTENMESFMDGAFNMLSGQSEDGTHQQTENPGTRRWFAEEPRGEATIAEEPERLLDRAV